MSNFVKLKEHLGKEPQQLIAGFPTESRADSVKLACVAFASGLKAESEHSSVTSQPWAMTCDDINEYLECPIATTGGGDQLRAPRQAIMPSRFPQPSLSASWLFFLTGPVFLLDSLITLLRDSIAVTSVQRLYIRGGICRRGLRFSPLQPWF